MPNQAQERLRVLQSFKEPGPRTNPYIIQLRDALAGAGVDPLPFAWRTALTGRYDVFHAHWPEALIERRGRLSTFARQMLYTLFLLRMWVFRIPVVTTMHNLELPEGIGRWQRMLLRATQRLTRVRIVLNEFTAVPAGSTAVLIEHGHYRDWFAAYPRPESVPGRLLFFGKVRRYKNVGALVTAFRAGDGAPRDRSLHILGSPSSDELADSLRRLADGDPRIDLMLAFADDAQLVHEAGEAAVVVLPYSEMHNSGSVLAALSLSRPVLVPDNEFNRALAHEVGEQWVLRYRGDLGADDLERALDASGARDVDEQPDLSRRGWVDAGRRHADAYRLALRQRKGRVR